LTYKSELLANDPMHRKILNSKDIADIFSDVVIMECYQITSCLLLKTIPPTNLISQKYRWIMNNTTLTENNPKLQNIPYD
jgi:hypothetical protein